MKKVVKLDGVPQENAQTVVKVPDSEVLERPSRRVFTAEYKRRILIEAQACREEGKIGALLRREGLYSSHLSKWQRQAEEATLAGLAPRKRGPKVDPAAGRMAELERDNTRLRRRLEQAEAILAIQKKLSLLLGLQLETTEDEPGERR